MQVSNFSRFIITTREYSQYVYGRCRDCSKNEDFKPHSPILAGIGLRGDLTFAHLRYGKVMALYLVGENIDRFRAFADAEAGALVSPYRGIYVDAKDDIDATVRTHAIRIAAYLYPQTYLSGASSARLSPSDEGRLFLSGRRNMRTRIRGLEIIQNVAPDQPSTIPVIIGDDIGELDLRASSPRQRFLEAFRQRSEHASAIDPPLRRQMAERLLDEYKTPAAAADALWILARANRWTREGEAAERYLTTDLRAPAPPANKAALDLTAAWHGDIVGRLVHDGAEWRWIAAEGRRPLLVRETRPGSLPPFIESLLPEGWLAKVLGERDERETLSSGSRYMSNMTIVADPAEIRTLPADILEGRLAQFQQGGLFTGHYDGPKKQKLEDTFQEKLARMYAAERTPRLSGVQVKAPMCLRADGQLIQATDAPFTHILKPAGTNGFEALPMVEWITLTLARGAGFDVPEVALVEMPEGMSPALLVERFDIRRSANDTRRLALEDFCSVLDLPASRKYEGTIERVAKGMRPLSTDPGSDIETLFSRAVFAWLVADGDMHLKNIALLKISEAGEDRFTSVRFAPVYDVVTTQVFPGLQTDRMALKLNGKDDHLTADDFLTLGRTIELLQNRASQLLANCARQVAAAVEDLALPPRFSIAGEPVLDRVRTIVRARTAPLV